MTEQFYEDLEKAKDAEYLVRDLFASKTTKYRFERVAEDKKYYYKGDIRAIALDGHETFIEVKDDSRICDTHNVLCEESVYYKDTCEMGKGNMKSHYDIYCVVSRNERKVYVMDFPILQANYKKGYYKIIEHPWQRTYCYLCSLSEIKKWGALIDVIEY